MQPVNRGIQGWLAQKEVKKLIVYISQKGS